MRNIFNVVKFACFMTLGACGPAAVVAMPDLGPPDLLDCNANPVACGMCKTDTDCAGVLGKTRCDTRKHVCIECLPAGDNCPNGKVCTPYADGYACSVSCLLNVDCAKLGGGIACCAGSCRDPKNDVMNCGGCNLACPSVPNSTAACAAGKCALGCTGTFKDCDIDYNTGCEVDTTADIKNCGACGNTCTNVINGNALCAAGACSTACKPGFADCNKNLNDGCEVDITFDVLNCGACGTKAPPAANALGFCENGKPSFRCKGHFFDCDGNAANGCELDASTDANNCGHCGNVCPTYANASSSCAAAACTVSCNNNYGDCNKNVMDGCETPLQSDLKNCGACGKLCSGAGAVPTCAAGMCTLACLKGFGDCNNDTSDGCEVSFSFDSMNCGACGNVCPMNMPFCNNSVCSTFVLFAQPSYNAQLTFRDALSSTTMTMSWDGTSYWSTSGGGPQGVRLAQYDSKGNVQGTYQPNIDFRSIFTKGPAGMTIFAREYASTQIRIQTAPGVFGNDVTLKGANIDAQAEVVSNETGTEFLAMSGGTITRWDNTGNFIATVSLAGYGNQNGENSSPQNRAIIRAGNYFLTYSNQVLSAWDNTGVRQKTTILNGAGTGFDSYYGISYGNHMVWIVDFNGGTWRGYNVGF